jgi:hypothetical protein
MYGSDDNGGVLFNVFLAEISDLSKSSSFRISGRFDRGVGAVGERFIKGSRT